MITGGKSRQWHTELFTRTVHDGEAFILNRADALRFRSSYFVEAVAHRSHAIRPFVTRRIGILAKV